MYRDGKEINHSLRWLICGCMILMTFYAPRLCMCVVSQILNDRSNKSNNYGVRNLLDSSIRYNETSTWAIVHLWLLMTNYKHTKHINTVLLVITHIVYKNIHYILHVLQIIYCIIINAIHDDNIFIKPFLVLM